MDRNTISRTYIRNLVLEKPQKWKYIVTGLELRMRRALEEVHIHKAE
jgi:hypothetical protein